MRAPLGPPTPERRTDSGLTFDADRRLLGIGALTERVAVDGGNEAVLETYVRLTTASRGLRPSGIVQVRAGDLDALSVALDLDHHDIRTQVSSILGTAAVETTRLLTRIRQRRFLAGVVATASGLTVVGGLAAAGAPAPPASAGPARPAAVAASAPTTKLAADPEAEGAPSVTGPVTVTADGVGLILPLEVDHNGVGLIPPVTLDRPAP